MAESTITAEYIRCDLCGEDCPEVLCVGRDRLHGTAGQWRVVRCGACGMVYTNPRPAMESVALVYPADYRPHRPKRKKRLSRRWRLQQWSLRHHWNYPPVGDSRLIKAISWPVFLWTRFKRRNFDLFAWEGDGKLLDYGCGGGGYLRRMSDRGWNVAGMDVSDSAVEACKKAGFEVRAGSDPRAQYEAESFDVVTLWHVLEHVPSPTETLRQVRSVLKPNGKLVLGLPNFGSWIAQELGPYWYALDLPRHVNHFTPDTIGAMLRKTGFRIERIHFPKFGPTVQGSLRYLVAEKPTATARLLVRSEWLCGLSDTWHRRRGQGAIMNVHARRTSGDDATEGG